MSTLNEWMVPGTHCKQCGNLGQCHATDQGFRPTVSPNEGSEVFYWCQTCRNHWKYIRHNNVWTTKPQQTEPQQTVSQKPKCVFSYFATFIFIATLAIVCRK